MADTLTTGTACIPNIGPRERRKRLVVGVVMLACGILLGAAMVAMGAPRVWRPTVFVPLLVGALGLLQARDNTCLALAARGARNMDGGDEPIADATELSRVRAQARRVRGQAIALAALLSGVLIALPPAR